MLFILLVIGTVSGLVAVDHYAEIDPGINRHLVDIVAQTGVKPAKVMRAVFQPYKKSSTFCTNPIKSLFIGKMCKTTTIGICWGWDFYGVIEIADIYKPGSVMEEQLIWHEAAHCLYNIRHSDQPGGCEDCLIMNPSSVRMSRAQLEVEKGKLVEFIKELDIQNQLIQ